MGIDEWYKSGVVNILHKRWSLKRQNIPAAVVLVFQCEQIRQNHSSITLSIPGYFPELHGQVIILASQKDNSFQSERLKHSNTIQIIYWVYYTLKFSLGQEREFSIKILLPSLILHFISTED